MEITVTGYEDIIALDGLSSKPKIVFVNLQKLRRNAVGPRLDPAWNAAANIDALKCNARFDIGKLDSGVAADLSQRMRLGLSYAGFNVGERLAGSLGKQESKTEFGNGDDGNQLWAVRGERANNLTNCRMIGMASVIEGGDNTRVE